MIGGRGDDEYHVDTVEHWDPATHTYYFGSDQVIENADEGSDLVISTVTYTLPDNVERLTLDGFGSLEGTGNSRDNELIGNSATNRLCGCSYRRFGVSTCTSVPWSITAMRSDMVRASRWSWVT